MYFSKDRAGCSCYYGNQIFSWDTIFLFQNCFTSNLFILTQPISIRINLLCESSDVWKELGCHSVKHSRICKKHLWKLSICYLFYWCALNVLTWPDRCRCYNLRCFALKISPDDYLSGIWMQLIGHNIEHLTFKQESIVILHWKVNAEWTNKIHWFYKLCLFRVLYWDCVWGSKVGLTNLQP